MSPKEALVPPDLLTLTFAAAGMGALHTALGPDHYLPFVLMEKASAISRQRLFWLVAFCGLLHCGSTVVLAAFAVWAGRAATDFEVLQGVRGDIAAWAFVAFGVLLVLRGLRRRPRDGGSMMHLRPKAGRWRWALLLIFVLGPCEWLIPAALVAAADHGPGAVAPICIAFSLATMATMVVCVAILAGSLRFVPRAWLDRHAMVLMGLVTAGGGGAILFGL